MSKLSLQLITKNKAKHKKMAVGLLFLTKTCAFLLIGVCLVVLLTFSGCVPVQKAQYNRTYWLSYYAAGIASGNKPIDAGPNWTIERVPQGQYILKEYFYDTRKLVRETWFSDRNLTKKEGPYRWWMQDGTKYVEGAYHQNKQEGIWNTYHPKTGKLSATDNYRNDSKEGISTTWSEQGIKTAEGNYVNNEKDGIWSYYSGTTGELISTDHYERDGDHIICTNYLADGTKTSVIHTKNGKYDGLVTRYNKEGTVIFEETWVNGVFSSSNVSTPSYVEKPPMFICNPKFTALGKECPERSLQDFLAQTIRYPSKAKELDLQGRVIAQFVIGKKGEIEDIIILYGICAALQDEVIRVLKAMPNWEPGYQNDHPVKVKFTNPILFKLE